MTCLPVSTQTMEIQTNEYHVCKLLVSQRNLNISWNYTVATTPIRDVFHFCLTEYIRLRWIQFFEPFIEESLLEIVYVGKQSLIKDIVVRKHYKKVYLFHISKRFDGRFNLLSTDDDGCMMVIS